MTDLLSTSPPPADLPSPPSAYAGAPGAAPARTSRATLSPAGPSRAKLSPAPMSPVRRGLQLVAGLLGYSVSMALMMQAAQGSMPWDVLHQGVVRSTGLPFGWVIAGASALVLLAWIPLRQRPGIGTVANVVVISLAVDPALALVRAVVPEPGTAVAVVLVLAGVLLNGVSTAAYIGVRLGPGPRDGLMTGIVARTGYPVRAVRTVIEVAVVLGGLMLGGTFGWATVVYALGVGLVVQAAARFVAPHGLAGGRP